MMPQKQTKGFTLLELMVSSAIFAVLIAVASGTFINAIRTQRIITDLSESLNNVTFAIEEMAREIRVGYSFEGSNKSISFYKLDSSGIDTIFVEYRYFENGIQRQEDKQGWEFITSPDVNVSDMHFRTRGQEPGDREIPRVTVFITVAGEKDIEVDLQTTISSRNLDS